MASASEVEAEYLAKMGAVLGTYYYALYKEVTWVHARWQEFRRLFAEKESVELLNQTAAFLFKLIQEALWESTLLHIARLTDPAISQGNENLSIRGLASRINEKLLSDELELLVADALAKAQFAREHRNKRLAHRDLAHAVSPEATPLNGISRMHVEEMLEALRKVMNRLELHYRNGTVMFEHFISSNDAKSLLYALESARKSRAASRS